ncbi:MAG: glycosyltransferase family 2 protein [Pseudomonadota bacterium]
MSPVAIRLDHAPPDAILCLASIRNEAERLPQFLAHYRALGVGHFLIVAHDCTDDSTALLADQADVSLWRTDAGYKAARFGVDWTGRLLQRYGHGRWCLTVDADELLIYPHWTEKPLQDLTSQLAADGRESFGTLSIDLYPKGPLSSAAFTDDALGALRWMDAGAYRQTPQPHLKVDLFQGGVRDRVFFTDAPRRAPTMNKVPLVKWHWRYAYRNATHSILPPRLNQVFSLPEKTQISGALLHTKFLPSTPARASEEKRRQQHFAQAEAHHAYYDALIADPDLWSADHSVEFIGWQQLVQMGLMATGPW